MISCASRSCVAHDQLERFAQDLAALARLLARPSREGGAGGVERGFGVLDRGARHRGDFVLGRRIDHVEAAAVGGFAPLAADPQIGRDVGEQIVVHGALSAAQVVFSVVDGSASQAMTVSRTRSAMRAVGSARSSRLSAAGSGICGVVIRTGGPSRS